MKRSRTATIFGISGALFAMAFLRVHISLSATTTGYKIGELKDREVELLEYRGALQAQYAKMSGKDELIFLSRAEDKDLRKLQVAAN